MIGDKEIVQIPDVHSNGGDNVKRKNFIERLFHAPFGNHHAATKYLTMALIILLVWALLYATLDQEVVPGEQLFMLLMLTILSSICGWLVSLIKLPSLLGMLICGIFMRNVGLFEVSGVYLIIVNIIREIALCVILLEAGLGLDASTLKRLSFVVARLAIMPCLTETIATAVAIHFLMNMPWIWGLLLGSILSAVTPAVVIPSLLSLKEKGYGEKKGISTLVIAASSIDDIVAVSIFSVLLGIIFSEGDLLQSIIQGPVEIAIGLVAGVIWGIICACFPHREEDHLVIKRSLMVGGGGLVAVLIGDKYGYSGSGPLASIILSFIASLCWKWQGWSNEYNPVADVYDELWILLQPLLFGLIGTDIVFDRVDKSAILNALGVLAFGLSIRFITCCIILIGANLNMKEIIFVNLAWLPKATVQATLGPIALGLATKNNVFAAIPLAENVLTIAVLSILLTAPVGAIGIALGGPRLLSKDDTIDGVKDKKNQQNMVEIENAH
ncbi:hypothetical protein V9T40_013731 [Parthenolecanium corni]|uniref:Cation/H+ exchanger transmembrane domain-containing protein n=1 Tax=Parthenolecanium corni TaxID=536013 RepID=A0AAN9TFH7_9HEMI